LILSLAVLDQQTCQYSPTARLCCPPLCVCGQRVCSDVCSAVLRAAPPERGFTIEQFTTEYAMYQNSSGGFNSSVLTMGKNQPAHLWWQQWGKSTPALQFVAMRALAQTCSASCSEQAWSEYDIVHCRRRNRLEKAYASNLTRGHNQARFIRRMVDSGYQQKFLAWTDSDDDEEAAFFSN
jgi:hypothetical protein